MTDTLPAGLTYVPGGSGGTGWTCGASGQVVTCSSTSAIAASGSAAPININVAIATVAVPSVTNSVTVAGGSEPKAARALASVVVSDSTPPFTVFVSAQCLTPLPSAITACNVTTQPAPGAQGSLLWTLTGTSQAAQLGAYRSE